MSFREDLAAIESEISAVVARKKALVQQAQAACPHPKHDVREGRYVGGYCTRPPFRVCTHCGYAEQGWGAGYWKLPSDYDVAELPREVAYRYVVGGVVSQEDMMGPEHDRYGHHGARRTGG